MELELMKARLAKWKKYFGWKPVSEWPMNMRAAYARLVKDIENRS